MPDLSGVAKAIDNLNTLLQADSTIDQSIKKIEQTNCCLAIVNGISSSSSKNSRNFSKYLGLSIKTLLALYDDDDSDIRTLTDECLNKIIRSMSDGNILKIQFEFYNEIQRNGNWRSLCAALRRFGLLSHTIKPIKGKPYISNLIPCIVAISKRTEEIVIDTLSESLPLILKSLGPFMSDEDTKTLLKTFYPYLSSSQAIFRRNAAEMIFATCIYCRKPRQFLFYVLQYLIDSLIPISSSQDNLHLIIGVLGCLKIILPHIDIPDESDFDSEKLTLGYLLQIYKICLHYIQQHSDHNVINAALETLAQILHSNNNQFINVLTSKKKISNGDKNVFYQKTIKSSSYESTDLCDLAGTDMDDADMDIPTNDLSMKKSLHELKQDNLSNSNKLSPITAEKSYDSEQNHLNIGSFMDEDVPLKYCCRYLASAYLLAGKHGQLISDELFRVSVKSLALTCIGNIICLYPNILLDTLEKITDSNAMNHQMIVDILLFIDHSDPQLRGNVAIIVGQFLNSIYIKYRCSSDAFSTMMQNNGDRQPITLDKLVALIIKALEDESATTCRHALSAVNICLNSLLYSNDDNFYGIRLIHKLLPLANNIYFLVKINLAQVLSELPYITIKYLTSNSYFQNNVIKIYIKLLGDNDPRVRHAVSNAIIKFIEMAYIEKPHDDEIIRKAMQYSQKYLAPIIVLNPIDIHTYNTEHKFFVDGMVEPFHSFYMNNGHLNYHENIEDVLSIVVGILVKQLIIYPSKHSICGCIEALSQLNEIYPTTLYPNAWDCRRTNEKLIEKTTSKVYSSNRSIYNGDNIDIPTTSEHLSSISDELLSLTLSIMTTDSVALDLSTHKYLLLLAGNLLSGIALKHITTINISDLNNSKEELRKMWKLFDDENINNHFEILFQHIMRLINIYVHIIDDIAIVTSSSKSGLSSLPIETSLSPRKKISINFDKKNRDRGNEKMPMNFLKSSKELIGQFYSLPHYVKLYDILKAAYVNYKSTLDVDASQMYFGLLNAALEVMSQILEIASTYEARIIAEEILHYLETTLTLSMTPTVQCVRQLLKSLFGMNVTSRWNELEDIRKNNNRIMAKNIDHNYHGLYDHCFQKPARLMTNLIKAIGNNCRFSDINDTWIVNRQRESEQKFDIIFKSIARSNNQKTFFASYIRIFEPMVIKSLKLYTTTNSVDCQCQVLSLLSQLVQFHVNYCLLDTDKTFINFVIGQFVFIEESQIPHTEILLPKIFTFLVNLSYEKFHSKIIIDIREIIKLCDDLMASGQSPLTHCIPALIPVVRDMFISRSILLSSMSASERAELDTTREYLMSMLLRLINYYPVIDLLAQCLRECRRDDNGEEIWRKWSRSVMDALLPALTARKICIESEIASIALIQLFATVSPTVYRPIDPLLKVLFAAPPTVEEPRVQLERWLTMINIIFLVLISYTKEDILLARLFEMQEYITDLDKILYLPDALYVYNNFDPLNVINTEESRTLPPERKLVILIFRVLFIATAKNFHFPSCNYSDTNNTIHKQSNNHFIKQLAFFIQLCIHMFESGSHRKVAKTAMVMLNDEKILRIDELNKLMMDTSQQNSPLVTTHWIYLMTLLGYSNQAFWTQVLGIENRKEHDINSMIKINSIQRKSIDTKIIYGCATILFCDYICDNLNDAESLSWLMINHIEDTINLSSELPVKDLVTASIHRNSAASGLLIQAIAARCSDLPRPSFVKKLLRSLECAHESQSGAVILTIIPKFLSSYYLVLSTMAAKIAEKKIEMLLKSTAEDVTEQLSVVDLSKLMETLQTLKLAKKHENLVNLLNKLATKFYDMSPLELEHCRPLNPQTMNNVLFTKSLFISQVRLRCCNSNRNSFESFECAQMLQHLDIDDCDDILLSKEFDVRILKECIELGLRLTLEEYTRKNAFVEAKDYTIESKNINSNSKCVSSIYISAKRCLSTHVCHINELLPKPHYIYEPLLIKNGNSSKTVKYANKFTILMNDQIYWDRFFAIVPAIISYMKSISKFAEINIHCTNPKFDDTDLAKFAMLCLEVLHWMIHADEFYIRCLKPHELELCLNCAAEILKYDSVCCIFGNDNHYTWVCSAANTLSRLIEFWLSPKKSLEYIPDYLPQVDDRGLIAALNNELTKDYALACLQMARLVLWMESDSNLENNESIIPKFARDPIISMIIIISRQKLVNSFVLTPPSVWKYGWHLKGSGTTLCHFPLLLSTDESNFLHELDVLRQFVYRITLLGWTSRHQFEEIWMALLSVLGSSINESKMSYSELETLSCNSQATSLAIQGITRLLIQTLLLPNPGNPVNSLVIHYSRDPPLSLQKPSSRRLYVVQDLLTWKYEYAKIFKAGTSSLCDITKDSLSLDHLFTRGNIERDRKTNGCDCLSYSQLSVTYLWSSCSLHEDKLPASVIQLMMRRNEALSKSSLDLASCIRFLIELYSQWMLPITLTPLHLLDEVVKSTIAISDLFVERSQFQWMLDTCWNIERSCPVDDEIIHHSLIFAICKAAAVLAPLNIESLDKVKRVIEIGLKSTYLPCRIATLHGILYLLQSAVHANCEETMNIVHPLAIKYIQSHLDLKKISDIAANDSEEHHRIMWALVFYLLEHGEDVTIDADAPAILDLALTLATQPNVSVAIHRTLLNGLERLIATRSVIGRVADQIIKLSLDRMKQPCLLYVIPALRLLLTCMYNEAADRFNRSAISNEDQPLPDIEPEALMCTIERTSAIFDRIKRGHPREVKILCAILSEILGDFFPPFETLTKVIGEFLSPHQSHQRLISGVVFKVCERITGNAEQLALLQDWVLFSLPNFIQSLPLITSTWCLSCFFVSASTNPWLRALFPYVQSRIGKYEYEDKKILCIAALDFYRALTNESQQKVFVESFTEAENQPGSCFNDIVTALQITNDG